MYIKQPNNTYLNYYNTWGQVHTNGHSRLWISKFKNLLNSSMLYYSWIVYCCARQKFICHPSTILCL